MSEPAKRKMPFRVTFFSYKGGAGRSVACANVSNHLVKTLGRSVAVFDFDIESVGQSYIHRVPKALLQGGGDVSTNWVYVQDLLNGERKDSLGTTIETLDFKDKDKFEDLSSRMLLDVTETDKFEGYKIEAVSTSPRKLLVLARPVADVLTPDGRQPQGGTLRSVLVRLAAVEFALFDSPSGTQPLATLARRHSQALVVLCRPSRQFLEGTRYFLHQLVESTREEHPPLTVLFVLSAVPMGDEFRTQRDGALSRMAEIVRELKSESKVRERITFRIPEYHRPKRPLVIPEVARLKWQDEVLPLQRERGMDDDTVAGTEAYRRLAEILRDLSTEAPIR
jgi:cellulose biosynthesis protein BcsQ